MDNNLGFGIGMVLVVLVFVVSTVPAAATEVYFVPDPGDATNGETFFVEMWLDSTEGVTAFQAEIYFNSTVVNITDVKSGDYSNSFMWSNLGDYIRVLGHSEDMEDYPPGSYLLANFTLEANNNGASPLHYTDWCSLCNVSYHEVGATWKDGTVRIDTSNFPPSTPGKPSGPAYGINGSSYTFSTSATDPDGDRIMYGWDWNGDGTVDEWTNLMASGTTDIRSHSWEGGIYNITVKAKDEYGAESAWSSVHMVHINSPPSTPSKSSGPTLCSINKTCYYSTSATDLDGDRIMYGWDWNGDGTVDEWTNLKTFGTTIQAHSWMEAGTYNVKVKAKDEYGEESAWSNSLTVNVTAPVHNLNSGEDFSTIQAAIDAVNTTEGHTITVDPAMYNENVDVYKSLTIISTSGNPDDTIVQAANSDDHVFEITADNVTISGFTVKGATGDEKAGIYLYGANHSVISNNNIQNNSGYGIYILFGNHNKICCNEIKYNGNYGIKIYNGSGNRIWWNDFIENNLNHPEHTSQAWDNR